MPVQVAVFYGPVRASSRLFFTVLRHTQSISCLRVDQLISAPIEWCDVLSVYVFRVRSG